MAVMLRIPDFCFRRSAADLAAALCAKPIPPSIFMNDLHRESIALPVGRLLQCQTDVATYLLANNFLSGKRYLFNKLGADLIRLTRSLAC